MKSFFWATVVAASIASASIGSTANAETIPIIVKSTQSYYFQIMMAGARQAGKDLGINVPELGPSAYSDIAGQISILENAVANKANAIVIAPQEFSALGPAIAEAAEKVPVVAADSSADTDRFSSILSTDNKEGGRVGADALAAAITATYGAPEGDVALLVLMAGQSTIDDRAAGFKEQLAASYPKLRIVSERVGDGQVTNALNTMTDLLTSNPDLRGVFATADISGEGASQAIAENNVQDKIKLVSFDFSENLVSMLKSKVISALVVQDPYRMGYDGIKAAHAAVKGEKVEPAIDTGVTVITGENVMTYRAQQLVNPKIN